MGLTYLLEHQQPASLLVIMLHVSSSPMSCLGKIHNGLAVDLATIICAFVRQNV